MNFFDFPSPAVRTWAEQFISGDSGDRNTDISIVKVKNAPPPCLKKVEYHPPSPPAPPGTIQWLTPTYDGANCHIKPVVAGATPFIWSGGYYVAAGKSSECAPGQGILNPLGCYFMQKPDGGFLDHDAFYVPAGQPGNTCSSSSWTFIPGVGCLVKKADWTTHAWERPRNPKPPSDDVWDWYFTPKFKCADGSYDSANCYVMKAPAGTLPFIYNNAFYYKE